MAKPYRVAGARPVHDVKPGDTLEHDFSADEEAALLAGGRLQLLPRAYRVVGTSNVFDTAPGERLEQALTIPQEQALITGGHIEVDPKKAASAATKAKE